jgi:histidinol-phosphatase
VHGEGAWAAGEVCRVSAVARIEDCAASTTSPREMPAGWSEVVRRAWAVRGLSDFWQHCLVAEGALDVAVDAVGVAPYDLAAVRLLVEEAGGTFTDRHGVATHTSDTAISTNGRLHAEVLGRLRAG